MYGKNRGQLMLKTFYPITTRDTLCQISRIASSMREKRITISPKVDAPISNMKIIIFKSYVSNTDFSKYPSR